MRISDWSSDVCSSDLQDHLRKPRQRMVRADGLILEDIERCCRYPAVGERIEQGSLLDQRPSGDVDDHRTGLDLAQRLFVEQMMIFRRQGAGEYHEVVPAKQRFESSEEHTSELQSLMRISYAVFCLKKKTK